MRTITVRAVEQLPQLLDYVHDRRFALESIEFDAERGVLLLPVEVRVTSIGKLLGVSIKRSKVATASLLIRNVTAWRVSENQAQIGYGDINRILINGDKLLVEGSLPVNIEASITALDLELIAPDELHLA